MGSLVFDEGGIEIWNTPNKNSKDGWIGIFNRTEENKTMSLKLEKLGLDVAVSYKFYDVWNVKEVSDLKFEINPNGVIYLKYSK